MIKSLRGAVLARYKSISDFASAVGWSRGKAWRIINDEQDPDADEITAITRALNLEQEEFLAIFFKPLSTMWTSETIS